MGVVDLQNQLRDEDDARLRAYVASCLDEHDVDLVEELLGDLTGENWRSNPAAMARHLDPTFRTPAHVRYLSEKFRQLTLAHDHPDASKRQIWNLPGRYGKTRISTWGVTWQLDRRPEARFIYLSYGDVLAEEAADWIRENLRTFDLRAELRRDRQRLDRFVTREGGGLLAAGLGSSFTGFGAGAGGGLVIDDPHKNWQEAHSETRRQWVYDQIRGTALNRLDDEEAFILVIHHRMHEDDLTAKLLGAMAEAGEYGDRWDVTALPSLAGADDPLGRAPGEPLDPERFPRHVVLNRIAGMGSYLAGALELQNPTSEEGNDIKRAWWRIDEGGRPDGWDSSLSSWDLKLKDKEAGDFVVGQLWARAGSAFWCLDELRGQWNQATTRAAIALMAVRHPWNMRHVVEHAASGPEVIDRMRAGSGPGYEVDDEVAAALSMTEKERGKVAEILRAGLPGVTGKTPRGDKRVRARAVAPLIETRNCHLPAEEHWVPGFLDEISAFPKGAHDDRVDAMSQALSALWQQDAELVQPEILLTTRIPQVATRLPQMGSRFGR